MQMGGHFVLAEALGVDGGLCEQCPITRILRSPAMRLMKVVQKERLTVDRCSMARQPCIIFGFPSLPEVHH